MSKQAMTFEEIEDCFPEGVNDVRGYLCVSAQWLHDFAHNIEEAIKQHDAEPVGVVCEDDISGTDVWEVIDWTSGERPPVGTKLYLAAPSIPEGFVLVPKEPTDEMLDAGDPHVHAKGGGDLDGLWHAMLYASPQPVNHNICKVCGIDTRLEACKGSVLQCPYQLNPIQSEKKWE